MGDFESFTGDTELFYSKKTGRMTDKIEPEDKMSSAELASYLKSLKEDPNSPLSVATDPKSFLCPVCGSKKELKFKHCFKCFNKSKKFKKEKALEKGREAHLKRKREAAKLPAKNRKKSEIIESFLKEQKLEELEKKSIRYESLERKLLLKELESF